MTEPTNPKPELEIKSDADWKQRVKAEAAQLDAERGPEESPSQAEPTSQSVEQTSESENSPDAAGIDPARLPPADFMMLVSMFSTQAMVALGAVPSPVDGQAESNLPLARHFIDLLGILEEKTRGNLSADESRLLEQSLHDLRMAFVELSRAGSP